MFTHQAHHKIKKNNVSPLHPREDDSLMLKFFKAQQENPYLGDWSEQVKEDLDEIGMEFSMEETKPLSEDSEEELRKQHSSGSMKKG